MAFSDRLLLGGSHIDSHKFTVLINIIQKNCWFIWTFDTGTVWRTIFVDDGLFDVLVAGIKASFLEVASAFYTFFGKISRISTFLLIFFIT